LNAILLPIGRGNKKNPVDCYWIAIYLNNPALPALLSILIINLSVLKYLPDCCMTVSTEKSQDCCMTVSTEILALELRAASPRNASSNQGSNATTQIYDN
jgi:hypothetical protein